MKNKARGFLVEACMAGLVVLLICGLTLAVLYIGNREMYAVALSNIHVLLAIGLVPTLLITSLAYTDDARIPVAIVIASTYTTSYLLVTKAHIVYLAIVAILGIVLPTTVGESIDKKRFWRMYRKTIAIIVPASLAMGMVLLFLDISVVAGATLWVASIIATGVYGLYNTNKNHPRKMVHGELAHA